MTTLQRTQTSKVIEGAAQALRAYGDVRFSPDPFSASRMDLLFTPRRGPHAGCVYLVDYWAMAPDRYLPGPEIAYSRSKRPGLREVFPERDVHVVVSTNGFVGNSGVRLAESGGLQLIPRVSSGADLAARVVDLTGFAD